MRLKVEWKKNGSLFQMKLLINWQHFVLLIIIMEIYEIWLGNYHLGQGFHHSGKSERIAVEKASLAVVIAAILCSVSKC